jgi:hypothetical protein
MTKDYLLKHSVALPDGQIFGAVRLFKKIQFHESWNGTKGRLV